MASVVGLAEALASAMPGWDVTQGPTPFGWAPDRHFRAGLARDGEERRVVVRQSWHGEAFATELFVYRHVLPKLPLRTARLWATFGLAAGTPKWWVLEDVGEATAEPGNGEHRKAFLAALGLLHGGARDFAQRDLPPDAPLPSFAEDTQCARWRETLSEFADVPGLGVEPWAVPLLDSVAGELRREPITVLHGDTDWANGVFVDGGVALIDWENAAIGPAGLDLGRVLEQVASPDELASYREAWERSTGEELSEERLQHWADLGDGYNCIRWVCHYLVRDDRESEQGLAWRRSHYEPCLARLRDLAERHSDWA